MSEKRIRVTLIGLDGPVFSRRAFLRGTLLGAATAGTSTLSACMPMMPPQAAAPAPAAPPMVARGLSRNVPKDVARYQNHPNRSQRCGACMHFRPPDSCEIVTGRISPQGWCRYFEAMV